MGAARLSNEAQEPIPIAQKTRLPVISSQCVARSTRLKVVKSSWQRAAVHPPAIWVVVIVNSNATREQNTDPESPDGLRQDDQCQGVPARGPRPDDIPVADDPPRYMRCDVATLGVATQVPSKP